MHEMGITSGIIAAAVEAAEAQHARRIDEIRISVGDMTEIVETALQFAFEVMREGTLAESATLVVQHVSPKSRCQECGTEFAHDKWDLTCPKCGTFMCEVLEGRELRIDSIEIDTDEGTAETITEASAGEAE
jgi:hydrogenase nickel incorporation protein HypA/HybF